MNAQKKVSAMLEEFKNFAFKGNVVDLAIGVIIAAAFGKIIDSLVKHIIMPLIGVIVPGEQGYLSWKWVINGKDVPYGLFIGEIVNVFPHASVMSKVCAANPASTSNVKGELVST